MFNKTEGKGTDDQRAHVESSFTNVKIFHFTRKNVQIRVSNRNSENLGRPRKAAAVPAQRVRPKPDRNFHILKDER